MANRLKMARINAIHTLLDRGWSYRRIARELGLHRETVARYARLRAVHDAKPAISTPGNSDPKPAISTPGAAEPRPAISTPGTDAGRRSSCEPFRSEIEQMLDLGLSAQRIYQDLVTDHDFDGSYQSVKRFVRKIRATTPLPFRRLESLPGEEAQIDFGQGALTARPGRKTRRRPHLFRILLSHSRKAYSEVVWNQTTDEFIRCLENAFRYFGGVPKTLVVDNLKAAVIKADWFDPDLNPKLESFARYYGTIILPTKPRIPRHKGKVESQVNYSQENALKGRDFASLQEQNRYLRNWEDRIADQRIHGTTRRQVRALFEENERQALLPLPTERFPCFSEAERKVHRDGHIALNNAYYSVPPEYVGRQVWVRWESRFVRIFNKRLEQIAVHVRVEPGRFSTHDGHIADEKRNSIEWGEAWLLDKAARIGPYSARWARDLIRDRGLQGLRPLQGFLSLSRKHRVADLENACKVASSHQAYRLKTLRRLLATNEKSQQIEFLDEHPLIRGLAEYANFLDTIIDPPPPSIHEDRERISQ